MFNLRSTIVISAILLLSTPALAGVVGISSTKYYQYNWLASHDSEWGLISNFRNGMQTNNSIKIYSDLSNSENLYWQTSYDADNQRGIENVDLYFAHTHGGSDAQSVNWGMYESGIWAQSKYMKLGDTGSGLSIFSTYSCNTMMMDGNWWTQWYPIFSGGLYLASGNNGATYDGSDVSCIGSYYASYLKSGRTLSDSWLLSNTCASSVTPAMVQSTGTNVNECYSRAANMTWLNVKSFARYRNGQVASICGYYEN